MHYVAPPLQVSKLAGGRGQSSTTSGPSPPAVLPPLLLSWLFPRAATKPPSAGPLRRPAVSTTSSSAHVVDPMPSTPGRSRRRRQLEPRRRRLPTPPRWTRRSPSPFTPPRLLRAVAANFVRWSSRAQKPPPESSVATAGEKTPASPFLRCRCAEPWSSPSSSADAGGPSLLAVDRGRAPRRLPPL
jgi:hypothetical protein